MNFTGLPKIQKITWVFLIVGVSSSLIIGVLFRSWGVIDGSLGFWADEAWWASTLVNEPIQLFDIRPLAYMYLSKALSQLGPEQELLLRLPSYIGGIGTLICVTAASFHLLRSKAAIFLVVYLTALNPNLIVFSKEFKPYSLEVFLHALLTLWALHGVRRGGVSKWFWAACAVSFLFCYNIVFLLPALLIALSPECVRKLRSSGANMFARMAPLQRMIVIAAVLGILLVTNHFLYSMSGADVREAFWGNKYDVFPVGKGLLESVLWYAEKTWHLITAPGHLHGLGPTQGAVVQAAFFMAYLVGALHLFQKQNYSALTILAGPLLTVGIANLLGYWPYGDFRTNLFLFPGLLLLAGIGFDKLATLLKSPIPAVTGVALIVAITFPTDLAFYRSKSMAYHAPAPEISRVLDAISERLDAEDHYNRNIILTDWHSWRVMEYYINTHPTSSPEYADIRQNVILVKGPLNSVEILQNQLRRIQYLVSNQPNDSAVVRVWIVVTKLSQFEAIEKFPLVAQNTVFRENFDTTDANYHPMLFELRLTKSIIGLIDLSERIQTSF